MGSAARAVQSGVLCVVLWIVSSPLALAQLIAHPQPGFSQTAGSASLSQAVPECSPLSLSRSGHVIPTPRAGHQFAGASLSGGFLSYSVGPATTSQTNFVYELWGYSAGLNGVLGDGDDIGPTLMSDLLLTDPHPVSSSWGLVAFLMRTVDGTSLAVCHQGNCQGTLRFAATVYNSLPAGRLLLPDGAFHGWFFDNLKLTWSITSFLQNKMGVFSYEFGTNQFQTLFMATMNSHSDWAELDNLDSQGGVTVTEVRGSSLPFLGSSFWFPSTALFHHIDSSTGTITTNSHSETTTPPAPPSSLYRHSEYQVGSDTLSFFSDNESGSSVNYDPYMEISSRPGQRFYLSTRNDGISPLRPILSYGYQSGSILIAVPYSFSSDRYQVDIYEYQPGALRPLTLKYQHGVDPSRHLRFFGFNDGRLIFAEKQANGQDRLELFQCR